MPRATLFPAILFAFLFLQVGRSFGHTITVDSAGGGDYLTVQDGIDASVSGDTVRVSPGTYTGPGNLAVRFHGKAILVVSSDGPETTIIDCQDLGQGFVFDAVEGGASVLDGFTIEHGSGGWGGGIRIYYASPTITHCRIRRNSADSDGGGIYVVGGAPDINHCTITENFADNGAGIYAGVYSGGFGSGPRISNCTLASNSAYGYGGGVCYDGVWPFSYAFLWGCRFIGNFAYTSGGGLSLGQSKVSVYNCLFSSNMAQWSPARGAAVYVDPTSDALIHNCTMVQNVAGEGGAVYGDGPGTTIFNCVTYWNGAGPIAYGSGAPTVTYSDVQYTLWPGAGNISADPLFAEEFDYHLSASSPCVDTGDPSIDDGSLPPGLGGARSDMGAYGGSSNGGWREGAYDLLLYPTGPTTVTVGDTVTLDGLIWNSQDNPAGGDYWLSIVPPSPGTEILVPPSLLNHANPLSGSVPAHGAITISSELRTILAGTYTVIARIGVYPNTMLDEETLVVQVDAY